LIAIRNTHEAEGQDTVGAAGYQAVVGEVEGA
jgi:hypothetical protein